ncbi:MAG: hypothetical protein M1818_008329 [Claussenomyces sp. TS43310]|nr:MAG: hypothetical protein M1818_008329 [Claussenomyces sp. TS43310]
MAAALATRRPPRLGKKEIFLPNFTLTLLRTPNLPPTFASFIVPLHLNKLDLRDYLFNGYGVRVRAVRSFIQQQKVRQDKPGAKRPAQRHWYRPRSIKKMMVELERPFVWPEEPEDFEPWDRDTFKAANKDQRDFQASYSPDAKTKPSSERASIAQQAKALLKGEEKWAPSVWEDFGEAQEVEKDVTLPKE